ncbi:hypothetical protein J7K91_02115, partial [bacterium]|nr:hypothetical protein [bacterium]
GEVIIKGDKKSDSRELLIAAIDRLASKGANLIWIRVNSVESRAVSHYKGFVVGGSGGGVLFYEEKVALSGGTGIGRGTTSLEFQHFPVVQAVGYKASKVEKIKEEKVEKEITEKNHRKQRKQYEVIRN